MGRIHILPDILAHKIAAGEVVERPASVLKELLENALDAGAQQVTVEARGGGRDLIRVLDDGIGMSAEDARLAFQHHATSKIGSFEDLGQIRTLGFRGEALPSIASVARLRLRTAERTTSQEAAPLGTLVELEGGQLKSVKEIAWTGGTEVLVEDLFFNVPARRKFLKAASTELGHLSRQLMHYAIAYPEVSFQFAHQERSLLDAPAASTLQDRIFQLYGEDFLLNLVPLEYEKEGVSVRGFTSLPHEQRSSSNSQFLYVNRRMVKDRILLHALRLAYQDLIPSNTHPVIVLFVEIDPQEVDVNVHPSKTEIRFRNPQVVHSAIYHGIEEALRRRRKGLADLARDLAPSWGVGSTGPRALGDASRPHPVLGSPAASVLGFAPPRTGEERFGLNPSDTWVKAVGHHGNGSAAHAGDIPVTDYLSPIPVVLGQFVESFVVAVDREGVMLVDQHVAHERILYDRALRVLNANGRCPIQRLLVPLTYELDPEQKSILEEILEELNRNGFEVEWFGARTVVIKGIPSFARDCDAHALIEGILDAFSARGEEPQQETLSMRLRQRIAIGLSCRGAIKINTPLPAEKMQWLLDELFRCENPYTCPHGRPIILRLGIEEILRGFKRI